MSYKIQQHRYVDYKALSKLGYKIKLLHFVIGQWSRLRSLQRICKNVKQFVY